MRVTVFGGTRVRPLQHLGEAQSCFLLTSDDQWSDSVWVTDDRDAFEFAQSRGILTRGTVELFRALVADGDLTPDGAFAVLQDIYAERGLRIPSSPRELL
ncbi:hypothetical protein B277_03440 [Janibacter hoylei PVAS-1]|uniref:Uncharacterized protein n=1 Tax=Janibacter hoylei PVAS-1 TaxID=1210046 RepID=K1E4Q4_9MICO|nr:hypothetical protein B277_03440 [Janibacter hoylei PVAS-1]